MYKLLMDNLYPNRHLNSPKAIAARKGRRMERYRREARQIENGLIPYNRYQNKTDSIESEAERLSELLDLGAKQFSVRPQGVNVINPHFEEAFKVASPLSPVPGFVMKNRFNDKESKRAIEMPMYDSLLNQAFVFLDEVVSDISRLTTPPEIRRKEAISHDPAALSKVELKFSQGKHELFDLDGFAHLSVVNTHRLKAIVIECAWHAACREFILLPSFSAAMTIMQEQFLRADPEFAHISNGTNSQLDLDHGPDFSDMLAALERSDLLSQGVLGRFDTNNSVTLTQYFMRCVRSVLDYSGYLIAPYENEGDLLPLFDGPNDIAPKISRVPFCAATTAMFMMLAHSRQHWLSMWTQTAPPPLHFKNSLGGGYGLLTWLVRGDAQQNWGDFLLYCPWGTGGALPRQKNHQNPLANVFALNEFDFKMLDHIGIYNQASLAPDPMFMGMIKDALQGVKDFPVHLSEPDAQGRVTGCNRLSI